VPLHVKVKGSLSGSLPEPAQIPGDVTHRVRARLRSVCFRSNANAGGKRENLAKEVGGAPACFGLLAVVSQPFADKVDVGAILVVLSRITPLLQTVVLRMYTRVSWHAFRHASATLMGALGESIKTAQAILGHSDIETTLNTYMHVIPDSQRRAVERVAGVLFPDVPKFASGTHSPNKFN